MKKTLFFIFLALVLAIIVGISVFLFKYKQSSTEKVTKLSDFAYMLGKRVAFEGIVSQGIGNFEGIHLFAFGDPKLRMNLYFKDAHAYINLDKKLGFSSEHGGKQWVYLNGIITYIFFDIEKDPILKEEPGASLNPEFRYGILCLYEPQIIKVLSVKDSAPDTILRKIKVYPLHEEDKSLKSPFLRDANQKLFEKYVDYLRAIGN